MPRTASPAAGDAEQDTGNGGVIAPPPRAQLGASNPPEDDTYKEPAAAVSTAPKEQRESLPAGSSPPSAAATAALLRDKDQRIADLERELSHSAAEFAQLLDGLSQKESEAATYWQDRHEQAAAHVARAEGEIGLLRAEVEVRDAEKEELTAVWEALTGRLAEREREAAELRAQVRGLKEFVSTSTRTDGQTVTSDEVFGEGMGRLGNGLQNWVIVHFRKAKLGESACIYLHLVCQLTCLVQTSRKPATTFDRSSRSSYPCATSWPKCISSSHWFRGYW